MAYGPYLALVCYIPFIESDENIITSDLISKYALFDSDSGISVAVKNIQFTDKGVKLSFPIYETSDTIPQLECYNALILYHEYTETNSKPVLGIYRIISIDYRSGNNATIEAEQSLYNINPLTFNIENESLNPNNKYVSTSMFFDSHNALIRWGYAYNSVIKYNGEVNTSSTGSSDIYCPPPVVPKTPLIVWQLKPNFAIFYNNGAADDDTNNLLGNNIKCWLYVYMEPKTYEYGEGNDKVTFNISPYYPQGTSPNQISANYGVICFPIYSDEGGVKLIWDSNNIDKTPLEVNTFINEYSPYIYSPKISSQPPFIMNKLATANAGSYTNALTKVYIRTLSTGLFGGEPINENGLSFGRKVRFMDIGANKWIMNVLGPDSSIYSTMETPENYPVGFTKNSVVNKQQYQSYSTNPYVAAYTNLIRLTDGCGSIKDYNLLTIGKVDSFRLIYNEPLTPDLSKIIIDFDNTIFQDSLIQNLSRTTYGGLVTTIDLSIPISVDQWKLYLAENKNFFLQQLTRGLFESGSSISKGVASGNEVGAILGVGDAVQKSVGLLLNTYFTYDNLVNAPNILNNVKGNFMLNLMIISKLRPTIELYTSLQVDKISLFNLFLKKGIYLNKYLNSQQILPYLNIYSNSSIIKHDKNNVKYIEADVEIISDTTYNYNIRNKINKLFAKGINLINFEDNLTICLTPNEINTSINNLDDEEFNF